MHDRTFHYFVSYVCTVRLVGGGPRPGVIEEPNTEQVFCCAEVARCSPVRGIEDLVEIADYIEKAELLIEPDSLTILFYRLMRVDGQGPTPMVEVGGKRMSLWTWLVGGEESHHDDKDLLERSVPGEGRL